LWLKHKNILIRSAVLDDAPTLLAWWNDGRVMAHAGFPHGLHTTEDEVKAQIKHNLTHLSQRCMIEVNGQPIGECNFRLNQAIAEIGIKICDVTQQNKGLGTTILNLLIDYLFTDEGINRQMKGKKIVLDTNQKNVRAQHVYEKLGFKKVAVNVNDWKDQLGIWQTSVGYEMTEDDFKQLKS
jgi:RimJ/RimL family protein N-acetyltransferase